MTLLSGPGRVRIVGAGMAGLAAAVALARAGIGADLIDGAAQAGGRCRSYHDPHLGRTIDNGNHLVLSGNRAVMDYLATIGARDRLSGPDHADFAFADRRDGARWTVRINDGRLPWWVLSKARRVPGTSPRDYIGLARLLRGTSGRTVGERIETKGPVWDKLLEPVLLAALNTGAAHGSATLAAAVLRQSLGKGGRAARPLIAEPTLAAAFVDPALAWLAGAGAGAGTGTRLTLGHRLRGLRVDGDRVVALRFGGGEEALGVDDAVILAVPPWVAETLVPGLVVPDDFRAIVNAHFACAPPPGTPPMIGVVGGTAEWIFAFPDRLSVTISAADRLVDSDRAALAATIWADVAAVHGLPAALPPWQIVKERRATFAATPAQEARRPPAATRWRNLFLAGDWTRTGLPATIEGAIRSGETAARLARAALLG